MEQFNVRLYKSENKKEWDDFVSNAKNATFLFYRDFMDYHKDRFYDNSLMVFKGEVLFALLPANSIEDKLYSHQGLSYGGLIIQPDSRFEEIVFAFKSILSFIKDAGFTVLYLKSLPLIYHKSLNQEIDYLLTVLNAKVIKNESYYVIENLKSYNPNRNRKRAIKMAIQNAIEVNENDDINYFWEHILSKNLKEKFNVEPVHSIDEIQSLMMSFPNEIKFISAREGLQMRAGVVMFVTDQVAHFQYSSGYETRDENGALDLLFHTIIEKFKHKAYISFGSSSTDLSGKINKGLAYWKESFGAKLISQRTYEIEIKNNLSLNNIFK